MISRKKYRWTLGVVAAILPILYLVGACCGPMTVCLTFDDGLKAHATIAGPALTKNGWHGCFAIVTESDHSKHPVFAKYEMATREEIRSLSQAGHSVVSHTVTHPNLNDLSFSGRGAQVQLEIRDSLRAVEEITGIKSKYLVFPYNATNPQVSECVREYGAIPVECGRTDFGEDCTRYQTGEDIRTHLMSMFRAGFSHEDLMIHGIGSGGGWRAFTETSFARFLAELKMLENEGKIRVVDFDAAHECGSNLDCILGFHREVSARIRRQVFKLIYD